MESHSNKYLIAFAVAAVIHAVVFSVLVVRHSYLPTELAQSKQTTPIIKAVAIDQNTVEAEIRQIKSTREAKHLAELQHQQMLAKQLRLVRKQRLEEQKRLQALRKAVKQNRSKEKLMQQVAKKRLATLKKQQLLEKKRLEKIKKERLKKRTVKKAPIVNDAKRQARRKNLQKIDEAETIRLAREQQAISKYSVLIVNAISQRWILDETLNRNLSCQLQIHLAPDGTVLTVKIIKPSGSGLFDRRAQAAVYKASPLPVPRDPGLFNKFRIIRLTAKPEGVLSSA